MSLSLFLPIRERKWGAKLGEGGREKPKIRGKEGNRLTPYHTLGDALLAAARVGLETTHCVWYLQVR